MCHPPETAKALNGAQWRYTTTTPAPAWLQPEFDDADWQIGRAGFGVEVPNGKPVTAWQTSDIWTRHEFTLQSLPKVLSLEVHHDEDIEIYLNGTLIFTEQGHLSDYKTVPLDAEALKALKVGRHVLAVHCRQTAGGQFVDVGLVYDALPPSPQKQHNMLLDGPLK